MSSNEVDLKRRRVLTYATSAVGAVGVLALCAPFIKSWMPNARAKNAGAPVEVDISKLAPGELLRVEWQGKPVWVLRRSEAMISRLLEEDLKSHLVDPNSKDPQQPDYAQNALRSLKDEYLVLVGICTHLGCSPTFRPEVGPADLGKDWQGGFFCACHGSRFDLAGRVFKNVPAPTNLVVPNHHYINDHLILIGEDGGNA